MFAAANIAPNVKKPPINGVDPRRRVITISLLVSIVMLVGGYLGEAGFMNATVAFIIGMAGWLWIIYEIFVGEASKINAGSANEASQTAFKTLRLIVTVGWAIYPIGYVMGYMMGAADANSLNVVYNVADLVNKIAFGVAIWLAATRDTARIEAVRGEPVGESVKPARAA